MRYISDLHTTSLHDALPIYELEETDYFKDLAERLYIDWGISRRWDQKGTNEKPIIHIGHLPKYIFGGYENIVLKFENLEEILSDPLRRSEEHTSELQSRGHLVCRLLL